MGLLKKHPVKELFDWGDPGKPCEMANNEERAPFQGEESESLLTLEMCDQLWS